MSQPFIMTLCTANVCRSPVAHALLQQGLPSANVGSGGIVPLLSAPMDLRSQDFLTRQGADLPGFVASKADSERLLAADLILTMTTSQRDWVMRRHPGTLKRTFTLLELAHLLPRAVGDSLTDRVRHAARRRAGLGIPLDIEDPVAVDDAAYQEVMERIQASVEQIVEGLRPVMVGSDGPPPIGQS